MHEIGEREMPKNFEEAAKRGRSIASDPGFHGLVAVVTLFVSVVALIIAII